MPPSKHLTRRCAAINSINYQPDTTYIPGYGYKSLQLNTTSNEIMAGKSGTVILNDGGDGCHDGHRGSHLAVGAIVGIAVVGIVGIISIWWCLRRRSKGQLVLPIGGGWGGEPGLFQRMMTRLGKGSASRGDEEKNENESATVSPARDPYGGK